MISDGDSLRVPRLSLRTGGTVIATGSGTPMQNAGKLCHGAYPLHIFAGHDLHLHGPPRVDTAVSEVRLASTRRTSLPIPGPEKCDEKCNWLQEARERHGSRARRLPARG